MRKRKKANALQKKEKKLMEKYDVIIDTMDCRARRLPTVIVRMAIQLAPGEQLTEKVCKELWLAVGRKFIYMMK